MENKKTKTKKSKTIVTTETVDNNFSEFDKRLNDYNNNSSKGIDLKAADKVIKEAKSLTRNLTSLLNDTFNNKDMNEEEKAKNKKFLEEKFK